MKTDEAREPAIRVQGITKSFKELHVLRGVDFDVQVGSIFALLGSNGAGKTTLVRILSTLLKSDAGTATVHGFDVASSPGEVRASISLTGQFAAVDEVLTGRENLVLVAKLRHLKNAGAIADSMLARFSLTDAGDRKAATYSGGMRRRLDIAMSLIGNPPVIFLDEPTAGLDPLMEAEFQLIIREGSARGQTVLLSSHILSEVQDLCDLVAILRAGRLVEVARWTNCGGSGRPSSRWWWRDGRRRSTTSPACPAWRRCPASRAAIASRSLGHRRCCSPGSRR